jgi:glycosyltransferase involved in cell wall biosynthesis
MRATNIFKQTLKTAAKVLMAPKKYAIRSLEGLLFNMERLNLYEDIIDGSGWLFHKYRQVSGVALSVKIGNAYHDFSCEYGTPRPDVAKAYSFDPAVNSGLAFLCRLPRGKPMDFLLKISFADGGSISITVTPTIIGRSSWVRMQSPRRWAGDAWNYIVYRDFPGLLRYIVTIMKKFSPYTSFKKSRLSGFLRKSAGPVTLIVDHDIGGGANQFRKQWINRQLESSHRVLLLYYNVQTSIYCLQPFGWANDELFTFESIDYLVEMIYNLETREILLNEVYSFEDPLAIVAWVSALKEQTGARLTVAVHDYFMICPSYTLLDKNGRFCGIPAIANCQGCLPHHYGDFLSLAANKNVNQWRAVWGMCLKNTDVILCFSMSSERILLQAYPRLDAAKFEIRPHTVDYLPERGVSLNLSGPLNIGIVGTINIHKGVEIVRQMAGLIEKKQLPIKITVIGELDRTRPTSVIKITGRYERQNLPDLIESNGINIAFLPSICSETFSYVTEELIQLDVPLAVFNLGAPADRVIAYPKGLVINIIEAEYALNEIMSFYERLRKQSNSIS